MLEWIVRLRATPAATLDVALCDALAAYLRRREEADFWIDLDGAGYTSASLAASGITAAPQFDETQGALVLRYMGWWRVVLRAVEACGRLESKGAAVLGSLKATEHPADEERSALCSRIRVLLLHMPVAWAGSQHAMRATRHADACAALLDLAQAVCELRSLLNPFIVATEKGEHPGDETTMRAIIALDEQLEGVLASALQSVVTSLPSAPPPMLIDLSTALLYSLTLSTGREGDEAVAELRACLDAIELPPPDTAAAEYAAEAAEYAEAAGRSLFGVEEAGGFVQVTGNLFLYILRLLAANLEAMAGRAGPTSS